MRDLSRRIETAEPSQSQGAPAVQPPSRKKTDEMIVKINEWAYLVDHLKNSWEEVIEGGSYLYVNMHDKDLIQREVPEDAYIKRCPYAVSRPAPAPAAGRRPSYSRTQSFERRSPRY
jgi:hypothetical protein